MGQQRRHDARRSSTPCCRISSPMPRARSCSRRTCIGGADPAYRLHDPGLHRICLALAVHPQPADPPRARRARRVSCPELTIIDLPSFRADPARHGCRTRDGDRLRLHAQDRADRRHVLCGRDEEVGLHLSQLPAAAARTSCRCIARPMWAMAATWPCSSACRAPARRRCRPIRTAPCSATTSMAGARTASSISRAAATPRRSACRARPSRRSSPPPSASARCWRTSCSTRHPRARFRRRVEDREHALRLSARLHPQRQRHRPRRASRRTSSC